MAQALTIRPFNCLVGLPFDLLHIRHNISIFISSVNKMTTKYTNIIVNRTAKPHRSSINCVQWQKCQYNFQQSQACPHPGITNSQFTSSQMVPLFFILKPDLTINNKGKKVCWNYEEKQWFFRTEWTRRTSCLMDGKTVRM